MAKRKVIIMGGGFAGIWAAFSAVRLAKMLNKENEVAVYAEYSIAPKSTTYYNGFGHFENDKQPLEFKILLYLDQEKGKEIGYLYGKIKEGSDEPFLYNSLYQPRHAYIDIIDIIKIPKENYFFVNNALLEATFRLSVEYGAAGRIRIEANRTEHYFLYNNGFRIEDIEDSENRAMYYQKLAKAVFEMKGEKPLVDLGVQMLFLPRAGIQENMKKFNIAGGSLNNHIEKLTYPVEEYLKDLENTEKQNISSFRR